MILQPTECSFQLELQLADANLSKFRTRDACVSILLYDAQLPKNPLECFCSVIRSDITDTLRWLAKPGKPHLYKS